MVSRLAQERDAVHHKAPGAGRGKDVAAGSVRVGGTLRRLGKLLGCGETRGIARMSLDGLTVAQIRDALTRTRRVALVGASNKTHRASYEVMGFLLARGYDVTPVNPMLAGQEIHGRKVVATLDEAAPLEMVDLFRASARVGPSVDDAIRLGAEVVWMQLGVIDQAAAARARAAGITVAMDRCPVIEFARLGLSRHA